MNKFMKMTQKENKMQIVYSCFDLICLFDGISTFAGYLIPKLSF